MEDSSNFNVHGDEVSASVTPSQKQELLKFELQSLNTDLPPTCDGDNASVNEGCESPLSSWDSEPETDIPSFINCDGMPDQGSLQSINLEENYLDMEEQSQFVGVENTDDGLLWEMDNRSYEELLKKFLEKEEELRVSNFKLQLSEKVIINVCEELKLKEEELNKQKELSEEEIFELKTQIEESEIQLKVTEENMVKSELELVSERQQNEMLGDLVKMHKANETNQEQEVRKLKSELLDTQAKFSFDVASLSKMNIELTSKLEDCGSRNKKLKNKVRQYKTEKVKQEELHATQQMVLQDEIKCLKEELGQKMHLVEVANKELEMVVIERDEANAKIHKLEDEICHRDDKLSNIQKYIEELNASLKKKLSEKFKLKDEELNKLKELSEEEIFKLKIQIEKSWNQYELAEKLNQVELHSTQIVFQDEIMSLKQELEQRKDDGEATNKKLDMVVIELDEANVMIANLKAEISSRDDKISNMKKYSDDVNTSLKELMVDYNTAQNEVNNLKLKVGELENEVTRQNGVISDMAKGNKEALKQLHEHYESKLELYKTGYNELLQKLYR